MRDSERKTPPKSRVGFTLIELMIVVAVIGILTLIAVPRFASLIRKSNEAGTKGHLTSARSAVRLYYMDNDQIYPGTFAVLLQTNSKYLNSTIPLYTGYHPVSFTVDDLPAPDFTSDAGSWAYTSGGSEPGFFWIQCLHTDLSEKPWSAY